MKLETKLVQSGNRRDPQTGAVVLPIYHSTTYSHPALGTSTGFDYSRLDNPTRRALEETVASLEGGATGLAFASGMAAIACICQLFKPGDHIISSDDLYGGTYRLFEQVVKPYGVDFTFVDTREQSAIAEAIRPETKAIFIETPSNPTMKICDIQACVALAKKHGILVIVDNTFLTPYFQRPLELGADLVIHSGTKYLGGHNDVLSGILVAKDEELGKSLQFYQNSQGAVLGPQDSWLMLRGLKTLALRMEAHETNTRRVAEWLQDHPIIKKVYYPGLKDHPGRAIQEKQSTGYGGMISFDVENAELVPHILKELKVITFAESLGGVESLMTYPAVQTHADIPKEIRDAIGVTDTLLRFSVGIEHIEDILSDLDQAFNKAKGSVKR
ncbi:PLP-dependent aspartate aminotransferase family protein [Pullulanibacillus sp. KACC 23026]|uniref:trans-sulfuration enzyme family protein n=1 Tax=Pullulanibacillus sp. KACC 23026 TaxID=3028315 RepID=UPI0023AF832B|nr:PLP-dependent aspartate aminotransferase family protein [Pullulanibacillus sp. KACC 23026]WEG12995.1 PLP-dependent aspartate aminotransferase family protein [Pullulanibacillus sp. KACC 23026]